MFAVDEYGSRGGGDYALFSGGSQSEYGATGLNKSCDKSGVCSVDLYEHALHDVNSYLDKHKDKLMNEIDDTSGYRTCMKSPFNGIDLTIAQSRLHADGFQV